MKYIFHELLMLVIVLFGYDFSKGLLKVKPLNQVFNICL